MGLFILSILFTIFLLHLLHLLRFVPLFVIFAKPVVFSLFFVCLCWVLFSCTSNCNSTSLTSLSMHTLLKSQRCFFAKLWTHAQYVQCHKPKMGQNETVIPSQIGCLFTKTRDTRNKQETNGRNKERERRNEERKVQCTLFSLRRGHLLGHLKRLFFTNSDFSLFGCPAVFPFDNFISFRWNYLESYFSGHKVRFCVYN